VVGERHGLDRSGSGLGQVVCCESIKCGEYLE
jgi:hypothetical protein